MSGFCRSIFDSNKENSKYFRKIFEIKKCDSVKGYLSASQKYYIVYNYKKVKKILTLKAEKSVVRDFEVSVKCVNHLCKYHGTIHKVECQLFCKQKNCRFYNSYHKLPCEQKCQVINCELFDFFHESECKLRCTWENCLMFGNYHEKKCIHLDHEKSFEANEEGIIYNKVNYKEKTEKTEKIRMKKKSTKVNPKKVNKEQFKWNIPQNTYRNELYSRSYEFPLLGNSETQYFNRPDPTVYTSKPEAKIRYTDYYAPRPNYNFNEYQSSYNLPNITKTNKIVANEFYKSDSRGYLKLDEKYTLHRESNLDSNRKVSENNYFFPSTKCYCIFLGFCISCILIYLIA